MIRVKILCTLFSILISFAAVHAQGLNAQDRTIENTQDKSLTKSQLANYYYRDKEYEKAKNLFDELYSDTKLPHYFDYYINCLVYLEDYDTAIKELKRELRRSKDLKTKIQLGRVYNEMGDIESARELYDEILQNLSGSKGIIINIGNLFFNQREFEYAEKTYLRGREVLPGEMFHENLASVYAYMRDYDRMMKEYLALVKEDPKHTPRVQARINSLLRFDFDNSLRETFKREIIKSMQEEPDVISFNRLLIWMFVIEKKFDQALRNSIALDRRTKKEEGNILDFAKSAAQKDLFGVALEGLNYLLDRKPIIENYNETREERVRIEYLAFTHKAPAQRKNGESLIALFEETLGEVGYVKETADLAIDYAHLLSFYLDQSEKAYEVLQKAERIPGLNNFERSRIRIEIADIKVHDNMLWEASLLYAQIIERNRGNSIADEVKYKKARLAYFIGDIEWAKAQLDAIKASTSKLIANDAMNLSLLISSNYDLDTISEPLQMFARGDLLLFQNKDSLAFQTFDSIQNTYPVHNLNHFALMRKAKISEIRNEFEKASNFYEEIGKNFAFSTSADDAMYRLAILMETKLNNENKAQELYRKILTDYPGSIYVSDARKRFRTLRGDLEPEDDITPYELPEFSIQ